MQDSLSDPICCAIMLSGFVVFAIYARLTRPDGPHTSIFTYWLQQLRSHL